MQLAGVSILITSVTDCVAFLVSGMSRLPALKSFCIFAGVGVIFDFILEVTIFSSFLARDLRRQKLGKRECCGLCCCKATSCFFCCGKCSSYKQSATPDNKKRNPRLSESSSSLTGLANGRKSRDQRDIISSFSQQPTSSLDLSNLSSGIEQDFNGGKVDKNKETLQVRNSLIQSCLTKSYSRFITHSATIVLVLLFFALLTAFAAYSASKV